MPNRNYVKGRKKEYRIVKELREEEFDIVQRTAGSNSPVDIIAIKIKERKVLLVQSKSDSFSKSEEAKLMKQNTNLNGKYDLLFKVM